MSHFSPLRMLISPTLGYQELLSQAFELQDFLTYDHYCTLML